MVLWVKLVQKQPTAIGILEPTIALAAVCVRDSRMKKVLGYFKLKSSALVSKTERTTTEKRSKYRNGYLDRNFY